MEGAKSSVNSLQSLHEYLVSANCASESSMTTRWPIPAAVAPPPTIFASTIAVFNPSLIHSAAHAEPTMPAPIITTSKVGEVMNEYPYRMGLYRRESNLLQR